MKPLSYVVNLVQLDLQDFTSHVRTRLSHWAIHWVRHIYQIQRSKSVEVAYLTLNSVKNAPWPADYEYWVKMGVNIGGQLVTLTVNNDLILNRKFECGVPVAAAADPGYSLDILDTNIYDSGYFFAPHYRSGQFVGEMYGVGGGFNSAGYFRVDQRMRQFQFYNVPGNEVIMEYVADADVNIQTFIQASDVEVIRQYLHFQLVEHDRTASETLKMSKMGQYNAAMVNHQHVKLSFTASEYLDMCYSTTQSSPRR